MLKVRLTRTGRKKRPSYRVVVAEHSSPRDGRVVERIGYYDPLADPKVFHVDEDRVKYWLGKGAQPSRTVQGLLHKQGLIEAWQAKPMSKRALIKRQAAAEEASPADASPSQGSSREPTAEPSANTEAGR